MRLLALAGLHSGLWGLEPFRNVAARTTFAPGIGIPGRVWQSRAPIWSTDVARDSNFVRADVAAKTGLRTGFAFPILAGDACAGVIKFLSSEKLPPDRALLDMLVAIGRDIGQFLERTRAAAAVRESERQLRRVLDNLFTFVGLLSPEGVVLEVNRAPLEAAGIAFADVHGKRFEDCYWWSYAPQVRARLRDAIGRAARGEMVRYDVDVRMAGGRLMAIDFMLAPLRDDDGRITHLIPSAVDITERKRLT